MPNSIQIDMNQETECILEIYIKMWMDNFTYHIVFYFELVQDFR